VGDTLLMRRKRRMFRVPAALWKHNVRSEARRAAARLEFMGPVHHRVRNFVATELPRAQQPLSPEAIAEGLGLETERVREILDELEAQLTFLYRGDGRNVDWAYPVTAEKTPIGSRSTTVSVSSLLEGSTRWQRPSCRGDCGASI
jgi:hypothetical protein